MYYDEDCCRNQDALESLYTFTYSKNAEEKPVGFNGCVSIDLIDGVYIAKLYEQDAFLVIPSITTNGIHRCCRIYANQTQTPYPYDIKNCPVEFKT